MQPEESTRGSEARPPEAPRSNIIALPEACTFDSYLFVDNARFLSILAIVIRHTELFEFDSSSLSMLETCLIQARSFGVLLFFVTSGFLMSNWLTRPAASPQAYWRTRLDQVSLPWVCWLGAFLVIHLGKLGLRGKLHWTNLPSLILNDIFYESYWFVPVLLFSLALLLPMRALWGSWKLGALFFCVTVVYAANQYLRWFPTSHTVALFGYLFYLWLGIQLHTHFARVQRWLANVSWFWVGGAALAGLTLVLAEGHHFLELGYYDAYSVLNPTNQIYALLVLVVLLKLRTRLVPSFIDVRKESYGIYLSHQAIASVGRGVIDLATGLPQHGPAFFDRVSEMVPSATGRILVWFGWCGIIYAASLLLTKGLRHSRWSWLVGIRAKNS